MVKQTAGRDSLGIFAPKFAQLNDDVLFGEVWSREEKLSLRDRSMITVAAFMGRGLVDSSFSYHLANAKKNGVTKEEIVEVITQLAFYIGWPMAWAAFNQAKEIWTEKDENGDEEPAGWEDGGKSNYQKTIFFPIGEKNDGFAEYFVGQSYLAAVSGEPLTIFNVTFEPGCRNNWHIHQAASGGGQLLICVGGRGYYQEWGKEAVPMTPGTVIHIPANVKHWHGAAPDSWFSHLAIEIEGEDTGNIWQEAVGDKDYGKLK